MLGKTGLPGSACYTAGVRLFLVTCLSLSLFASLCSFTLASHGDLSVPAPGTDQALQGFPSDRIEDPSDGLLDPGVDPTILDQLSQQGLELKSQLAYLRGRTEAHQKRRVGLTRRSGQQQQALKIANRRQAAFREQFEDARSRLDAATLEYISLTTGVASSRSMGEEQALLDYLSESNPEDAVLLYQSAQTLLNTQTSVLSRLRQAATVADNARSELAGNVEIQEKAIATTSRDIEESRRLEIIATADMEDIRAKIKRYRKLQERYALLYFRTTGDTGTLDQLFTAPPSELAAIARRLLASPNVGYPLDGHSSNGSSKEQMLRIARGLPPLSTCSNSPQTPVNISPRIMYFLQAAAKVTSVQINALTDKCHSSGSNHYLGQAIDLDLQSGSLSALLPIAERYGGRKNSESTHHHIDFP